VSTARPDRVPTLSPAYLAVLNQLARLGRYDLCTARVSCEAPTLENSLKRCSRWVLLRNADAPLHVPLGKNEFAADEAQAPVSRPRFTVTMALFRILVHYL